MTVCDSCGELTMNSITICNDCRREREEHLPLKRHNFTGSVVNIGTGETHYTHGVMDYCNDGNGNEWFDGDEDDEYF